MKLVSKPVLPRKDALAHYQSVLDEARQAIDQANERDRYKEACGLSFPRPSCKAESAWPQEWDLDEQELLRADPAYLEWLDDVNSQNQERDDARHD